MPNINCVAKIIIMHIFYYLVIDAWNVENVVE